MKKTRRRIKWIAVAVSSLLALCLVVLCPPGVPIHAPAGGGGGLGAGQEATTERQDVLGCQRVGVAVDMIGHGPGIDPASGEELLGGRLRQLLALDSPGRKIHSE